MITSNDILIAAKLLNFPKIRPSISKKMQKLPQISILPLLFPFIFDKKPPFRHLFSFLFLISFCLSHPRLRRPFPFLLLQDAVVLALSLFKAIPSLCYLACPSRPFSLQKHPLLCDFSQPNIPKPDKIPIFAQKRKVLCD